MSRFDTYLKTYVESNDGTRLRSEIDEVWKSFRGSNAYSGGPRSSQTEQGMTRAITALKLASQSNDRALLAEACRLMAHTLNADEQYEQSIDYYQKAIALFEGSGSRDQAARTRLGFIAALYMVGKYDEALAVAGEAERWFKANNQALGLAKVYTNVGNLNCRREQYRDALMYHSKARALFEQLKDWHALAMSYLNVANSLAFTDQFDEADKVYNDAEELAAKLNMQNLFMQARYNKAYLKFLQGRHSESLETFAAVRDYFTKTRSMYHVNLCDLDVAEIYLHLMSPAEAVSFAERAADGFSKTAMRYERAKALTFCAMGLTQLERIPEAEAAAAEARKLFEAESNQYWISVVDFCLACAQMSKGEVAKAKLLAAQAELLFQNTNVKGGMAETLSRLGSMAVDSTQLKNLTACMTEVLKLTVNKRW
jgi:tetratricopeptide (TPR) repeat protein